MTDLKHREDLLHKIIATSGFLFALCILPVAQYYLVTNQLPSGSKADGQVAGVSTDTSITEASVPVTTPVSHGTCVAQKNSDLESLLRFERGNLIAYKRDYETALIKDQNSLTLLNAGDREKLSLLLFASETKKYNESKVQLEAVLAPQKKAVESRPCPA
jgi:hypothetical protein